MAIGTTAALIGLAASGAGASLFGAKKASDASKQAGQIQSVAGEQAAQDSLAAGRSAAEGALEAQRRAAAGVSSATAGANDQITQQLQAILEANGPYSEAGQKALQQLQQLYGEGGEFSKGFDASSVNVYDDPGYKFRLEQGQKGVEATAAARGSVLSSRAQKEVARFSQGLASTEFGNAFNRAFGTYQDSRNARTQALQGLMGAGQTATSQSNAARGAAGAGISNNLMTSAEYQGNTDMNASQYAGNAFLNATGQAGDFRTGAAASRAAGAVGSANAWNQGISGAVNSGLGAYSIYSDMNRPRVGRGGNI